MNKFVYTIIAIVALTSCAESYNIQGSSTVSSLDGSKLYLKAIKDQELKSIDSCDVVHGSIMPIVVEKGEIEIKIDAASQRVSGTPLNEKLYDFITLHNQLNNEMNELSHKQSQMLLDGIDEEEINQQLTVEAAVIAQKEDSLVTNFIVENFDNVLGPGVFMMMTSGYPYPVLTPQIEDIMSKASQKFKSDPYVSEYYRTANEIQARENGLVDDTQIAPPAEAATIQPPHTLPDSMHVPLTNLPQK